MTEEDIRGNLLLPYLEDLGFNRSEIDLERGFTIRLGRGRTKTGRSDILVKSKDKNLFIVEVKNDSIPITDDDRDQGISYARSLLDNIAPFTIVSNGKETKIYDSISREELTGKKLSAQSSFFKNNYTLSQDEEVRIRYEGLKNFIALSTDNLKLFCQIQVIDRMGQIVGSIDSPYSKFVKELHVQRQELQTTFLKFVNSNNSIFGLVGSAGVGKTSAMCSLALQSIEDKFVFFYNAANIKSSLESIRQDLNITFSNRNESDVVLKKLNELGRYADKEVLIFIDAIDENTNPNLSVELSEIALMVKSLDRVKIIISCKSNIWSSILKEKTNPTHLHEELLKFHGKTNFLNNSPGFLLKDFTDEELDQVIPLYRKVFGFKGDFSPSLLQELRNGFFLKIFSEVYSGKEIPEEINDKDLINKYLKQSLDKTNIDMLSGRRILGAIGKLALNYKYTYWGANEDEGMDANHILEELEFSLDESIPEDLFTRNILVLSNKEDSYNISFYYSKIRDYVICFYSYRLDKLDNEEFYSILPNFYENYVGQSAIDFYIQNASSHHRSTFVKFKRDKALQYVLDYQDFLDKNFKTIKNKFDPKTEGDIGIIIPDDLIYKDGYSLMPIDLNSESRVQHDSFKDNSAYDLYLQRGVEIFYASIAALLVSDQKKIIKKNVFKQLEKIVEKGKISTYNSDILLIEKVALIVYHYYQKLDYNYTVEDFYLPRYKNIYPIDLEDLKYRINRFRLVQFYRSKNFERKLIEEKVEDALKQNLEVPKYETIGDVPPFEELFKIVEILLKKGYAQIKNHYLPLPDKSITEAKSFYEQNRKENYNRILVAQFSEPQGKEYIVQFFSHLEVCYKDFVEESFPTLQEEFSFYKSIPHDYFFYMKDSNVLSWGLFGYRKSQSGSTTFTFKNLAERENAFSIDGVRILRAFSLDLILRIRDYHRFPVQTVDRINTSKVDEFCVIRNWIYKFLKDDMEGIFERYENKI